jgi:bifunctional UDP-N-acetylglucosamine pyrophosphorylase/glucosamine-1-phosphate N-acetyltransferase
MSSLAVVILAAGHGTRMNSKKQKILHEVGGQPMVSHVFDEAESVADLPPMLVAAPGETAIPALFGQRAEYVEQADQMGTGHATMMAIPALQGRCKQVLVTYADMPLLRAETMQRLAQRQVESGAVVVMLTILKDPPSSYGRVVRDQDGRIQEIVEVAEAMQRADSDMLMAIRELNTGLYCFDAEWLWQHLPALPLRQARDGQEYYLTDMIGLAVQQGQLVEAIALQDRDECLGAGTREEMILVEKAFRRRANARWLAAGVTIVDPESTYIDQKVSIGQDTIIWPNSYIQGETTIGRDCVIGPSAVLRDARIGNNCRIEFSVIETAGIVDGTIIKSFSHIEG